MPEADAGVQGCCLTLPRELPAHCYRMTGSVQEAGDIAQDSYRPMFGTVLAVRPAAVVPRLQAV